MLLVFGKGPGLLVAIQAWSLRPQARKLVLGNPCQTVDRCQF